VVTTFITIMLGALGSILAAEFLGWCPWFAERLLNCAVRRLPGNHQQRYRQEWLADMDQMRNRGGFSVLLWAVGLYLTAERVAGALEPSVEKQVARHYPTMAESIRATRSLLKALRYEPKSNLQDRIATLTVLRPLMFPLFLATGWIGARFSAELCNGVLLWANTKDGGPETRSDS
jgi:hypothetical protein